MKPVALICLLALAGCEAGQTGGGERPALSSETQPDASAARHKTAAAARARTDGS
jgi:predicted small lipoprotein YifL